MGIGLNESARCPYSIVWRGCSDWCQPWQFSEPEKLRAAVEIRLCVAGLGLVAMASELRRIRYGFQNDYIPLWCQVIRLRRPHERTVRINRMLQASAHFSQMEQPAEGRIL